MSAEVGAVKYKVELDDSGLDKEVSKTESSLASKFGSAAKGIAAGVGKAAIGAVAAGTAAVTGLVKTAADAYGDFEQLSGGVETLFGDSASTVMANAEKAFKTAGMSMNDYMETSIQSAASLINSLDGDQAKAAQLTDMSITDMADNVNKMGTDMEAVQNAYRGFSRGNFTMLDNLALGFAGTKEGMQELLDSAEQISGVKYDISSYSDIVEAIHVVQTEMGITGTTAKEAGETLQGSLGAMQAAWTNLTTGMADPDADIGVLVGNMVDSAETFLNNLIPIIEQALEGIATAIAELAPVLAEKFPAMIETVAPVLLETGLSVVKTLAEGIIEAAPELMPTAVDLILQLASMIIELAPEIVQVGLELIVQLALGIAQALPELIPTIVDCILKIVEVLTDPNNLMMLIDAAIAIILALADGLIKSIPKLLEQAPVIIENLLTALISAAPKLLGAALELIVQLVKGIVTNLPKIIESGGKVLASVIKGISNGFSKAVDIGKQMVDKIKEGISKLNPLQWGKDLISNFVEGIKGGWDALKGAAGGAAEAIASRLHFSVPDEGPLADADEYMPDFIDLLADGMNRGKQKLEKSAAGLAGDIAMGFTSDVNYNMPDIAGYARDLSASITGTGSTRIEVPVVLDGREIARASAWYMGEQLAWEAR